jgi:predicted transposase/invertase (TIGR01784 family)
MQVLNVEGFEKRILYNAAKSYSIQLTKGQGYNLLNPVIALTITDFVMFADLPNVTSRFVLKEKDFLIDYPIYDIELIFVELPKFKKDLATLVSIIDKWLYFLNNARKIQDVPSSMDNIPEIKKAFYIANQANLNLDELNEQEKSEIFIQDQRGAVTKAAKENLEQGRKEGRQEGLQQGLEQGLEQGLAQGLQLKAYEIARKMVGVLEDQAIADMTGLTLEELQSLRS